MISKKSLIRFVSILSFIVLSEIALAEETTMEKAESVTNQATDSVKETYRDAKDKACEMVNGKLECVGKKIKNKAKSLKDKTETTGKNLKNKVD